jgi:hypothetical protein
MVTAKGGTPLFASVGWRLSKKAHEIDSRKTVVGGRRMLTDRISNRNEP